MHVLVAIFVFLTVGTTLQANADERMDAKAAERFGISTSEYLKRKALAERSCEHGHGATPQIDRWLASVWLESSTEVIKSGHPPAPVPLELLEHGGVSVDTTKPESKSDAEYGLAVVRELEKYCPGGHPPCTPEPPASLLDEALRLGLIERTGPTPRSASAPSDCVAISLGQGDAAIDCR